MTLLVTGGCGFIGTNFIRLHVSERRERIVNLDKLTYAGNRRNLEDLPESLHVLVEGDVADGELLKRVFSEYKPRALVHLAAESHVDRSILGPGEFVRSNIVGAFTLLEAARGYYEGLTPPERESFRFLSVSTDEVFGSLGPEDPPFTEESPYAPNSPYSASKAAADHLVRAYHKTYGLPVIVTNCSNNYGPYQFPEKLIPLVILNALNLKKLPVYGDGRQIRDWLHVSDHCRALSLALEKGRPGESYNVGGGAESANIDTVRILCELLDEKRPEPAVESRASLIEHVRDRPGHDRRYAVDCRKIERELGYRPLVRFKDGLSSAVDWYLDNPRWVESVVSGEYRNWNRRNYGESYE
ncbi:MAG: dTDP-glucose 4,6-dehydratase [Deltaproteobacteria bacterium]|jgi:dTDP-glucose 4,6-dehydratase|nr:dTDP-glucose 4,6-dehydratase [Deltaproteobacteria bacterium]